MNPSPRSILWSLGTAILITGLTLSCRLFTPSSPSSEPPAPILPTNLLPTSTAISAASDDCFEGDCITTCMDALSDRTLDFSDPKVEKIDENYERKESLTLASYTVYRGDISLHSLTGKVPKWLTAFRDDLAYHKKMWQRVSIFIPDNLKRYMGGFNVVTDGLENTLASVYPSDYDPNYWILDVDMLDSVDEDYYLSTVAHEMSHLITLNPKQVKYDQAWAAQDDDSPVYEEEAAACPTYFPDGCSYASSYINQFFVRFWKHHKDYDRWVEINSMDYGEKYDKALEKFYKAHKDEFVTEYAATNLDEDMAEAFTLFLLKSKPAGKSIAEQKILFFYDFPELIEYRTKTARAVCDLAYK